MRCYDTHMSRTVTRTDEQGTPLGEVDILEAHKSPGILHRAFSVYVFTPGRAELLIQKRSKEKMLWPLVWANTCCSHPYAGEGPETAGERRLKEELGFSCALTLGPQFTYQAEDPAGLGSEHEYVMILTGEVDVSTKMSPDPKEVAEWKWTHVDALQKDMKIHPDAYAPWFKLGLDKLLTN